MITDDAYREKTMKELAQEIIKGKRLTREDDLSFFEYANLEDLVDGADEIRKALCKNRVDLCSIINGRSGSCSEDCKFCTQSSFNRTGCEEYDLVEEEEILADCREKESAGVHKYSIVTAGRRVEGKDLDRIIHIYRRLHKECSIKLCASLGLLEPEAFPRLREVGVEMYHENIETSERYFPHICTTHTYSDKISGIKSARAAGLSICSGGIIGMGETWKDRIDMALSLSELEIESIPINALIPIKGTPFENLTPLTEHDIIRTAAMFRYLNPQAYIRMGAGRKYFKDGGKRLFRSGVNATITGNMLTTVGNSIEQDITMLREMGFEYE